MRELNSLELIYKSRSQQFPMVSTPGFEPGHQRWKRYILTVGPRGPRHLRANNSRINIPAFFYFICGSPQSQTANHFSPTFISSRHNLYAKRNHTEARWPKKFKKSPKKIKRSQHTTTGQKEKSIKKKKYESIELTRIDLQIQKSTISHGVHAGFRTRTLAVETLHPYRWTTWTSPPSSQQFQNKYTSIFLFHLWFTSKSNSKSFFSNLYFIQTQFVCKAKPH